MKTLSVKKTTLKDCMTPLPLSVEATSSLQTATRLIHRYGIRQLPVMHANKLVGVVHARDIERLASESAGNPEQVTIEPIVDRHPAQTQVDSPLSEIVKEMITKKYEAVFVMEGTKIVGVFSTTDGLKLLLPLLA
jgi:acetoin utilization protein AcuB